MYFVEIMRKDVLNMPQNEWIKGALLIPENNSYKVDGSGRIVIPSYLRSKFRIEAGDQLEYFLNSLQTSRVRTSSKKL